MIRILAEGDANNGYLIGGIIALCLLIALIVINIVYTIKVNRVIARNEVGITSEVHIDPEDYKAENAVVKVVISNHNFRTINIIAFGIYYDKKLYDYIGRYTQETEVSLDNSSKKVYINSSDSIVITLSIEEIEKIVDQTKNLKKIQIMAQDSAGRVTKKTARGIRDFIKKLRKRRKLEDKTVNVLTDDELFKDIVIKEKEKDEDRVVKEDLVRQEPVVQENKEKEEYRDDDIAYEKASIDEEENSDNQEENKDYQDNE